MNRLSILVLSVGLIIAGLSNIRQDEKITQLSERIQTLEAKK